MDRLEFLTFEDFACEIADKFDTVKEIDEYNDVSVIAKYAEIKEVFKELVRIGYDVCDVELEMPDMDEYTDEYLLSLSSSGIWVEKFKREDEYLDGYLYDASTITYVLDNCASKVISRCVGKKVYEVGIGSNEDKKEYEINGIHTTKEVFDRYVNTYIKNDHSDERDKKCEDDCNDCNCFCDEDEDGNVHGFTVSKTDDNGYMSCSYYSSEGFDEDDMRDILELLGYRFKD